MKSAQAWVKKIEECAVSETAATMSGDPKTANKHAKRKVRAWFALRSMGDRGRDALVPLLYSPQPEVRWTAAAFLLRYRHDEARRVLEDLAMGKGYVAFGAGETLKRWAEGGGWQIDPE